MEIMCQLLIKKISEHLPEHFSHYVCEYLLCKFVKQNQEMCATKTRINAGKAENHNLWIIGSTKQSVQLP